MLKSERYVMAGPVVCPGPASLSCETNVSGITSMVPGVLGVNLLAAGPAAPWGLDATEFPVEPLAACFGERSAPDVYTWRTTRGPVTGTWSARFCGHGFRIDFDLGIAEPLRAFCPLTVMTRAVDGLYLLPGRPTPLDPDDRREISHWVESIAGTARFGLGSQGGWVMEGFDCSRRMDGVRLQRAGEHAWRAGLGWRDLVPGTMLKGTIELRVVPFNGAIRLEQIPSRRLKFDSAMEYRTIPEPTVILEAGAQEDGVLRTRLDDLALSVRVWNEGRLLPLSPDDATVEMRVGDNRLADRAVKEVTIVVAARRDLRSLRLEAGLRTPCGNPTWDGDATVVIPGNMARCNYHPGQPHGGGPKWGPDTVPTHYEDHVTRRTGEGACHGWMFPASRLPQVWTAAADRERHRAVWMGTTPRSPIGENCAGFVSPADGMTTLRLATPTTYEPWVPLGYARMRKEPRLDTAHLAAGQRLEWTFWLSDSRTDDLNAWAASDRALYMVLRPNEPNPRKMARDEAIRVCASAIYDQYYDQEKGILYYATGPSGRNGVSIGFTGMAHAALVMLWAGAELKEQAWREAGTRVLDTLADMFLKGPGFPFLEVDARLAVDDPARYKSGSGEAGYTTMAAFDNLAEALRREQAAGRDHPGWRDALVRCATHWIRNQSPAGAYPHSGPDFGPRFPRENVYEETNVEAGVIANMVDAWELTREDRFLDSAIRAAEHYAAHLEDGRLYGGPGDIRALVNSEVPMFFLRGFRRLYEVTHKPEHREAMLAAAAWRHSFQYAHSWAVDPGTPLYRQGWAGVGAESASACNLHTVAFGCLNVPDEWAVWKATGDEYHRMRCRDLARYSTQQYARFAGDMGFPFAGAGSESWWASDTVWGKGVPHIFHQPGFDLGYMSWVTAWAGYGALWARELGIEF